MAYLHEDDEIHPAVLIIPGGGYEFVSSREGEIVAKRFFSKGYNTSLAADLRRVIASLP